MTAIVDNMIAFKVLHKLVTPFVDTDAYRFGIIDAHGNVLRKSNTLTSVAEREAYTYLDRLVFNLKKILAKLPGGDMRLKNLVASMSLVKEYYENNIRTTSLMEARMRKILEHMDNGVILVEEEILVSQFLQLSEDGGAGGAGRVTITYTIALPTITVTGSLTAFSSLGSKNPAISIPLIFFQLLR